VEKNIGKDLASLMATNCDLLKRYDKTIGEQYL
jgi:hypothetical protein